LLFTAAPQVLCIVECPPIWGSLELEHPDTMNQRCTKLLEEILVKDAVHVAAAYHRVCKKVKEATGRDVK